MGTFKISAIIATYNEESRIRYALTSLQWCDEIVLLDKYSTDKTVEIAKEFGAKVHLLKNTDSYDASECQYMFDCEGDWIISFTAGDLLEPSLAREIRRTVECIGDTYDIIKLPFHQEILGLYDTRSPWGTSKWRNMFRKSALMIDNTSVHSAITTKTDKAISIDPKYGYMYHLTHVSVDMLMDRHIRYWRSEGANYNEADMWPAFKSFLRSMKSILKLRTLFIGWNGVALAFAYVGYYMMSFLYCWEHKRGNAATERYNILREDSIKKWADFEKTKEYAEE